MFFFPSVGAFEEQVPFSEVFAWFCARQTAFERTDYVRYASSRARNFSPGRCCLACCGSDRPYAAAPALASASRLDQQGCRVVVSQDALVWQRLLEVEEPAASVASSLLSKQAFVPGAVDTWCHTVASEDFRVRVPLSFQDIQIKIAE